MAVHTTKMHRILWLADIAAAGTAALRHLGNTPSPLPSAYEPDEPN
jgi:hypothetical protein